MKTYWVNVPVFANAGKRIQAETAEEAIKKAEEEIYPSLCHQCSDEVELGDPDWENATAEEITD